MTTELPFSIYNTFVLEEKHGFNQQTLGFFVKDKLKKLIVTEIVLVPFVGAITKIVQWGGDYSVLYLQGFLEFFKLFMLIVYPEVIAPLFDKYTPLPDGKLRTEIENLAATVEFPLHKLFVVEGSKRSSHSNAYFYGFYKFKRIVLFDTLLEEKEREKLNMLSDTKNEIKSQGCSTPEILAVLGHELGHWKLNHMMKNLIISEIYTFTQIMIFGSLYNNQMFYTAFGFDNERPVIIGFIILQCIMSPINTILRYPLTSLSRRFEFQADDFSATVLGKGKELQGSLMKLNNDNLGFPINDTLYSAWNHSHPPILERIAVLKEKESKDL